MDVEVEGYEARGVLDMSATDGDDGDDKVMEMTDLSSSERVASMAEFLARPGESQAV